MGFAVSLILIAILLFWAYNYGTKHPNRDTIRFIENEQLRYLASHQAGKGWACVHRWTDPVDGREYGVCQRDGWGSYRVFRIDDTSGQVTVGSPVYVKLDHEWRHSAVLEQ